MKAKNKIVHHKDRASFDDINARYKKGEGRWVTINGQHKFVAVDKTKKTKKK